MGQDATMNMNAPTGGSGISMGGVTSPNPGLSPMPPNGPINPQQQMMRQQMMMALMQKLGQGQNRPPIQTGVR